MSEAESGFTPFEPMTNETCKELAETFLDFGAIAVSQDVDEAGKCYIEFKRPDHVLKKPDTQSGSATFFGADFGAGSIILPSTFENQKKAELREQNCAILGGTTSENLGLSRVDFACDISRIDDLVRLVKKLVT